VIPLDNYAISSFRGLFKARSHGANETVDAHELDSLLISSRLELSLSKLSHLADSVQLFSYYLAKGGFDRAKG